MTKARGGCCLPAMPKPSHAPPQIVTRASGPANAGIFARLPGGWFQMGADDAPHPEDGEGPARQVFVDPFEIAQTAVTQQDFAAFVRQTGYRTVAERAGGSFVFFALAGSATPAQSVQQAPWWRMVDGASWRCPNGPSHPTTARAPAQPDHPVTHIAHEDALAFCHWAGVRLPHEAEWEFAARGGLDAQPFPWGETLTPEGAHRCNIWQGRFPDHNTAEDGFSGTAPVTSFAPNGFGLFNMTGNVWEWTADRFTNLHSPRPVRNPRGPLSGATWVAKGGSYLCHASYCARYRTSSRQPLAPDTTTGNLGFRVARDVA